MNMVGLTLASRIRPWRGLLGLTVVVLLAHLLLLEQLPAGLDTPAAPTAPPVFTTRSLPPSESAAARAPSTQPTEPRPNADTPPPSPAPEAPPSADAPGEATPAQAVKEMEREGPSPLPDPPSTTEAASATPPAPPEDRSPLVVNVPPAARLSYDLSGHARGLPYHANASLLWQHDGRRYTSELEIKAFLLGNRRQTSEGALTPQGLAPDRFADRAKSELAAHFLRDTQRVSFSANTPDAILQVGAQDKLSIFIQLGAMLAGEPQRWPVGKSLNLQVVGTKQAEPWVIHIDGWEDLALPMGKVHAIKLSRPPRTEYEPRVEVWLAPDLRHLPVRIRLSQSNGDLVDQSLNRIDWLSPSTAARN